MKKLNELRQKKGEIVKQMRDVHAREEMEKRKLTAEEESHWTKLSDEVDRLDAEIKKEERLSSLESELRSIPEDQKPAERPAPTGRGAEERKGRETAEYRQAFNKYLRSGQLSNILEYRDLQADSDAVGGYLLAPLDMVKDIIKFVMNLVHVRELATKMTVQGAESLGIPTLATDIADADWTSELAQGNNDTALALGRRDLRPHPLAKQIRISNRLLRQAQMSPEALVMERLAYKFAVAQEKAFLLGSGAQQPLGLFISSTSGIDSSRDFSLGNSTTAIAADALIECKYQLKAQYWTRPGMTWIFHRDAVRQIRKLKDGEGQYLWQPGVAGLTAGLQDRILEIPYRVSEYAPNTFTTGQYVGILGDMSFYYIVDSMNFEVQRLDELYAATNQTGFIGRMETDGAPVLAEAFARLKLA